LDLQQLGLLWLTKSRSQKNRQVPVLKVKFITVTEGNYLEKMVVCSAATFLPQYTLNSSFNDLIAYLILSGIEKNSKVN
jgi:hypothetical protein